MSLIIKTNEKISVKTLSEPYFIIDGSNVAFENKSPRNKPLYSNIQIVIKKLIQLEINYFKVICDNNLRYCITERNEYLKAVHKKQIIESPKVLNLKSCFNCLYLIPSLLSSIVICIFCSKSSIVFLICSIGIFLKKLSISSIE